MSMFVEDCIKVYSGPATFISIMNQNKDSLSLIQIFVVKIIILNLIEMICFWDSIEKCRKGGIMQALYATPAWACCFYVFMFFTLFLWEGWWIFFSCIIHFFSNFYSVFKSSIKHILILTYSGSVRIDIPIIKNKQTCACIIASLSVPGHKPPSWYTSKININSKFRQRQKKAHLK